MVPVSTPRYGCCTLLTEDKARFRATLSRRHFRWGADHTVDDMYDSQGVYLYVFVKVGMIIRPDNMGGT